MGLKSNDRNRRGLTILLLSLVLAITWSTQLLADERDEAIQDAILSQIEAFANNDQEQAWAHASEGIKRRFGSSKVFVDMVREAYPAVHSATAIEFTKRVPHSNFEIQVVKLQGPEGRRWDAHYRMVLSEGVWKIAGVHLIEAKSAI